MSAPEPTPHIQNLPLLCAELRHPGEIKASADDFIVTEIPLYHPCGEGDHLYITLRRREETTTQVLDALGELLNIKPRDIGTAGRKDKWATTTQTFSINLPHGDEEELVEKIRSNLSYEIISYGRHNNKLKMGHLLGNSFEIVVKTDATCEQLEPIRQTILEQGLPNFFGEQRYGFKEKNIDKGRALLKGDYRERKRNLRDLLHSAYQSFLFDRWLTARIEAGNYQTMLLGDVAKGTERGGLFTVEDPTTDQERFTQREICYTGALPGYKIPANRGASAALEEEIFRQEEISADMFKKARLPGSRRMGILWLDDLKMDPTEGGVRFSFTLPKGSYATTLLREFFIT